MGMGIKAWKMGSILAKLRQFNSHTPLHQHSSNMTSSGIHAAGSAVCGALVQWRHLCQESRRRRSLLLAGDFTGEERRVAASVFFVIVVIVPRKDELGLVSGFLRQRCLFVLGRSANAQEERCDAGA